jgi:glycerophosphoryl diester phosphodiesterase
MSDDPTAVRRRTFVQGTGTAAVGVAGLSFVPSAWGDRAASGTESHRTPAATGADEVTLVGHRGFAGVNPENTVGAVQDASHGWHPDDEHRFADLLDADDVSVDDGEIVISSDDDTIERVRDILAGDLSDVGHRRADMIEVDIMPCGDGDTVVFHDRNLSGLTDEAGVVWETDAESVLSAEVLESGETVPRLTEVMDAIPPEVGVNLEFKSRGNKEWTTFAEDVLSVAADYENDVLVSSFAEEAIAAVAENYPEVPIAFLFWNDIQAGLEVTDRYGCDAMNVPFNMVAGTPFFSENIGFDNIPEGGYAGVDLVEEADARGIDLNVWTVQTWYEAEQLVAAGVDGLIADYPNLL